MERGRAKRKIDTHWYHLNSRLIYLYGKIYFSHAHLRSTWMDRLYAPLALVIYLIFFHFSRSIHEIESLEDA